MISLSRVTYTSVADYLSMDVITIAKLNRAAAAVLREEAQAREEASKRK